MHSDTLRVTSPSEHDAGAAYIALDLPELFLLEIQAPDGSWEEEARVEARQFERLHDGSYICSSFGSGFWLRCVERHADHFVHVDGAGQRFNYRITPLKPSGT